MTDAVKQLRLEPTVMRADYGRLPDLATVDWSNDVAAVRRSLPGNVAVQGNLDPAIMSTTPQIARRESIRLLESMRGSRGHIFNLGHGILPSARIDCVEAVGTDELSATAS